MSTKQHPKYRHLVGVYVSEDRIGNLQVWPQDEDGQTQTGDAPLYLQTEADKNHFRSGITPQELMINQADMQAAIDDGYGVWVWAHEDWLTVIEDNETYNETN